MNKILNSSFFTQLEDTLVLEMSKKIYHLLVVSPLEPSLLLAQEETVQVLLQVEVVAVFEVA
jgi:hypothetical protein